MLLGENDSQKSPISVQTLQDPQIHRANLGFSLTSLGDVSGDGVVDFAIAARFSDDGGGTDSGSSYVFFGPISGDTTSSQADVVINGGAGEAYKSVLGDDARPTKESNAKVIKILKASSSVDVDGMTFTVDDISQVPCI